MSIMTALFNQIEAISKANHLIKIDVVCLEIGTLKQVVPVMLQTAFASLCPGTVAEGATLYIVSIPAAAQCRRCHASFVPEVANFLCPQCHVADARIVSGDSIVLKKITGCVDERQSPQ